MSSQPPRYSPELRQRAVRMVAEVRSDYASESAAIDAVATKLGIGSSSTLRRWVRENAQQEKRATQSTSRQSLLKRWLPRGHPVISGIMVTAVGGIVVTVVGGLLIAYIQNVTGVNKSTPQVGLDQLSVSPGDTDLRHSPLGRGTAFEIDIKLLNTGTQTAVINDARLVIEKFVKVPVCASQGGFPATGSYGATMPTDPRPGKVVQVPVSQLAPSNGADRFNIRLRIPTQYTRGGTVYLYLVRIYLNYDSRNKPLNAGRVLVDLPYDPTWAGGYFWTKYFAQHPNYFSFEGHYAPEIERCLIKNSHKLHSILSSSAIRTHALTIIPSELSFCCVARRND
jgi:hypothetical protein